MAATQRTPALRRRTRPLRLDALPAHRPQRARAARDLARPVAQLRRRPTARRRSAAIRPARLRPRRDPLRPRQQLRPALRLGGGELRAHLRRRTFGPTATSCVISTKAGYDMWPGPYGDLGSRKYLLVEPRPEPRAHGSRLRRHLLLAPRRPRDAARGDDGRAGLGGAPGQGALRRASRPTRPSAPLGRRRSCASSGRRCSSTSRRTRCSIAGSRTGCSTCSSDEGVGCIAFSPLAQGLLTDRYLDGVPAGSRASRRQVVLQPTCSATRTWPRCAPSTRSPSGAARRSPSWRSPGSLRDPRVTSALVGASSVEPARGERQGARPPRVRG